MIPITAGGLKETTFVHYIGADSEKSSRPQKVNQDVWSLRSIEIK